jgi:small subunit ribosomal protein S3Ae
MGKTRKTCQSIYSLHDVFIKKAKMLKNPTFELRELMESHAEVHV